jgi:hypothetical protein
LAIQKIKPHLLSSDDIFQWVWARSRLVPLTWHAVGTFGESVHRPQTEHRAMLGGFNVAWGWELNLVESEFNIHLIWSMGLV